MAAGILMPKAGITVETCIITKWRKQVGDTVNVGDIIFDYETDKATFECEATESGEILEIFFNDGDEVPCLVNVCAVGKAGEDCSALRPAVEGEEAPAPKKRATRKKKTEEIDPSVD
jgi:pyruvate/2-oxoglutarate dehydrogenase complex dihydrolipoamide acyltransferase (E2) component